MSSLYDLLWGDNVEADWGDRALPTDLPGADASFIGYWLDHLGGTQSNTDVTVSSDGIDQDISDTPDALTDGLGFGEPPFLAEVMGRTNMPHSIDGTWQHVKDGWAQFIDFFVAPDPSSLVYPSQFQDEGRFDSKNDCVVIGDVVKDIPYVDRQTHQDCSLMAQEQFVERYIGKTIPEDYLEWSAEKWGYYTPEGGTNFWGQTAILEHFNVPHERLIDADQNDLNEALSSGRDVIIGVDVRHFYNDPTVPEGSGHAVAIVGEGLDPKTQEIKGYYITDSNSPGAARFVEVDKLANAWWGDMISVEVPPSAQMA